MQKKIPNQILDEIYKSEDGIKILEDLQKKIDELQMQPENKNIISYLKNQQAQQIKNQDITKIFNVGEDKVSRP